MTRSGPGAAMPLSSPMSFQEVCDTPSTITTVTSPPFTGNPFGSQSDNPTTPFAAGTSLHHEATTINAGSIVPETDPFTASEAPEASATRSALSPTATSFTPGNCHGRNLAANGRAPHVVAAKALGDTNDGRVSSLQENSIPDVGDAQYAHGNQAPVSASETKQHGQNHALIHAMSQMSLGTASAPKTDAHYRFSSIHEGVLTSDEAAQRAIKINGGPGSPSLDHLQARFNKHTYPSCYGSDARRQFGAKALLVQFFDFRDAVRAYEDTRNGRWKVDYLNPRALHLELTADTNFHGGSRMISNVEGQLKAKVLFNPQNPLLTASVVLNLIKARLSVHGDIKAMHSLQPCFAHVKEYCIEFYDIRSADDAYAALNSKEIGCELSMKLEYNREHTIDVVPYMENFGGRFAEQPSITGRSTVPMNDPFYNTMTSLQPYTGSGSIAFAASTFSGANHNQVDIERIRNGLDVRTTIMLRNIPNRIDQVMLKSIIDETSFGQYDFMYLRIDFANNCNVGYAFINFEDPISIIDFACARAGRRWNRFGSDKVAEISYATIQGRDCLVQKFRNSSVMLEHPTFRPKLYTTGTGTDSGREEPFPGPDNHFKMRRSVENAETVGLFAPRHGQQYRDDQRRRRSQYDRGTTAAENEARYEGLYDPARLGHSGAAGRNYGPARFGGRSMGPPCY